MTTINARHQISRQIKNKAIMAASINDKSIGQPKLTGIKVSANSLMIKSVTDGLELGKTTPHTVSVPVSGVQAGDASSESADTKAIAERLASLASGGKAGATLLAPERRLAARSVGMDRDLSFSPEQLSRLGTLSLTSSQNKMPSISKTAMAVMMNLDDSVASWCDKTGGVDRQIVSHMAESVSATQDDLELDATSSALSVEPSSDAEKAVKNVVKQNSLQFRPGMDINAFVQAVLRESYLLQIETVLDFSLRVEGFNTIRKSILAKLKEARAFKAEHKEGDILEEEYDFAYWNGESWESVVDEESDQNDGSELELSETSAALSTNASGMLGSKKRLNGRRTPQSANSMIPDASLSDNPERLDSTAGASHADLPTPTPSIDDILNPDASETSGNIYSEEEMDAYIKQLETDLQTVGSDAQEAALDLQNATQRQQQIMQMMSNLSKSIHDTIMSVIRNIGG